jgi:hypothetical protein
MKSVMGCTIGTPQLYIFGFVANLCDLWHI